MAIDTIKTSAILDGSVTSADLDTNIDITGRVSGATLGVGTSTISSGKVAMDAGSNNYIRFADGGTLTGLVGLSDGGTLVTGTSDGDFVIRTETAGRALVFGGQGGGKWGQIDADGLKFNADTAAVNALDDYEQGTFTATVHDNLSGGNAASYSTAGGYYTKIGNQVFAHFDAIDIDTAGLTNQAVLCFNLPFTPGTTTTFSHNWLFNEVDLGANGARNYVFQCISGQTRGRFVYSRDNTTSEYLRENMIEDGIADIKVSFTYFTA